MRVARGNRLDGPDSRGRVALSVVVGSPGDDHSIGFERDGEASARGDGLDVPDSIGRGGLCSPNDDFIGPSNARARQSPGGGEQQHRAPRHRGAGSTQATSAKVVTGEVHCRNTDYIHEHSSSRRLRDKSCAVHGVDC